jgi:cellulose synthase/poly-beta-1,6-N-acetylglucosamine synthase-like glycosyltransferase
MQYFWPGLYMALLALAFVNLLVTFVIGILLSIGDRYTARIKTMPLPITNDLPRISLVAPARNEERNIEQAVRTLMTLDYPNLQITLVDDRSTDRTGEILARLAAEFSQLNVVTVTELPKGWLGKNHAMQLGADCSDGEWLLFTDADILFEPTTLRRTIAYALENRVDHLAATPDTRMPSWFLRSFVIVFAIYFTTYVRVWSIRNPNSTAHVGIGAFNLIRAKVYRAIGGHRAIAMRPDDDLKLGKLVKLNHYRQDLVHGGDMILVEWYASLREMIRGLEKNAFAGVDYSISVTVISSLVSLLFNVWPFIGMFLAPAPLCWLYALISLSLWLLAAMAAHGMKLQLSCALAFPVAVLLFVYIQWRTMLLNLWQGGIQWRDTRYSLAELRANKI